MSYPDHGCGDHGIPHTNYSVITLFVYASLLLQSNICMNNDICDSVEITDRGYTQVNYFLDKSRM